MTEVKDDRKVVFGIYSDRSTVERGVEALKAKGIISSDISVLMPQPGDLENFTHEIAEKSPNGAAAGAGAGLVVGGALGWLVGIGTLAIPGVGPLIAAGPIMALLAGAGAGAAIGEVTGALVGMGMSEYVAKRYEGIVKDGGILLSVHTASSEKTKEVKSILEQTGARDISTSGEETGCQRMPPSATTDAPSKMF